MSDFWKNYDSKSTFDGYISKEKKLRSHAKIIAGILEKYGKKKLQEIEKNCQSTISCLLYTSPSPRDVRSSRMPSSA